MNAHTNKAYSHFTAPQYTMMMWGLLWHIEESYGTSIPKFLHAIPLIGRIASPARIRGSPVLLKNAPMIFSVRA